MPNGHGGIPRWGAPVALALALGFVLARFGAEPSPWVDAVALAFAAAFGWRLAFHAHMWRVSEYGGAYASGEAKAAARARYLAGTVIYAACACALTWVALARAAGR